MRKQKKKSYQRCTVGSSGWTCKFYELAKELEDCKYG